MAVRRRKVSPCFGAPNRRPWSRFRIWRTFHTGTTLLSTLHHIRVITPFKIPGLRPPSSPSPLQARGRLKKSRLAVLTRNKMVWFRRGGGGSALTGKCAARGTMCPTLSRHPHQNCEYTCDDCTKHALNSITGERTHGSANMNKAVDSVRITNSTL